MQLSSFPVSPEPSLLAPVLLNPPATGEAGALPAGNSAATTPFGELFPELNSAAAPCVGVPNMEAAAELMACLPRGAGGDSRASLDSGRAVATATPSAKSMPAFLPDEPDLGATRGEITSPPSDEVPDSPTSCVPVRRSASRSAPTTPPTVSGIQPAEVLAAEQLVALLQPPVEADPVVPEGAQDEDGNGPECDRDSNVADPDRPRPSVAVGPNREGSTTSPAAAAPKVSPRPVAEATFEPVAAESAPSRSGLAAPKTRDLPTAPWERKSIARGVADELAENAVLELAGEIEGTSRGIPWRATALELDRVPAQHSVVAKDSLIPSARSETVAPIPVDDERLLAAGAVAEETGDFRPASSGRRKAESARGREPGLTSDRIAVGEAGLPEMGTAPVGANRNRNAVNSKAAAIFAAHAPVDRQAAPAAEDVVVKTFLSTEGEAVTSHLIGHGIGIAKRQPPMSTSFSPPLSQHPAFEYAGSPGHASVVAASAVQAVPATFAAALEPAANVNSAHRAVEVALQAAHELSSSERKSVDLQFSVGGDDLSVRVELRDNEVRATFRTESPDLRNALAHEWQAVSAAPTGERGIRVAPATFTTSDAANQNGFAGDASSRDRHSPSQRGAGRTAVSVTGRGRTGGSTAAAPTASAGLTTSRLITSRHLHTLA